MYGFGKGSKTVESQMVAAQRAWPKVTSNGLLANLGHQGLWKTALIITSTGKT